MERDKKAAAKEYLESVLARLPEDKRGQVQVLLGLDDVLDEIGAGVLRQSEFSQHMDALRLQSHHVNQTAEQQAEWWKKHTGLLQAGASAMATLKSLKARGVDPATAGDQGDGGQGGNGNGGGGAVGLTKEEIDALIQPRLEQLEAGGVAAIAQVSRATIRHFREFNEDLDINEVYGVMGKTGKNFEDAYNAFVEPRRTANAAKVREKEIADAEARGAQKAREQFVASGIPYDVDTNSGSVSPFMANAAQGGKAGGNGVMEAVADYNSRHHPGAGS